MKVNGEGPGEYNDINRCCGPEKKREHAESLEVGKKKGMFEFYSKLEVPLLQNYFMLSAHILSTGLTRHI